MITVSTNLARRLARAKAAMDAAEKKVDASLKDQDMKQYARRHHDFCRAGRALADELIANRHHETEVEQPQGRLIAVMYNPMFYESAYSVVSLHRTHAGAVAAMRQLKADCPYDGFNAYRYGIFEVEGC